MNPTAPTIRGLIKIHKAEAPIRPIINWSNAPAYKINWSNAPAYKIAKALTKILSIHIPLPYAYNVKNSMQLIKDLQDTKYNHDLRLASFGITNMYTNIPTKKTPRNDWYNMQKQQYR